MKLQTSKLVLALGFALTLAACADLHTQVQDPDRFDNIHAGLTQADVKKMAGSDPVTVETGAHPGETVWDYAYTDTWGYRAEFDITFDKNGVVTSVFSKRLDD